MKLDLDALRQAMAGEGIVKAKSPETTANKQHRKRPTERVVTDTPALIIDSRETIENQPQPKECPDYVKEIMATVAAWNQQEDEKVRQILGSDSPTPNNQEQEAGVVSEYLSTLASSEATPKLDKWSQPKREVTLEFVRALLIIYSKEGIPYAFMPFDLMSGIVDSVTQPIFQNEMRRRFGYRQVVARLTGEGYLTDVARHLGYDFNDYLFCYAESILTPDPDEYKGRTLNELLATVVQMAYRKYVVACDNYETIRFLGRNAAIVARGLAMTHPEAALIGLTQIEARRRISGLSADAPLPDSSRFDLSKHLHSLRHETAVNKVQQDWLSE